MILNTAVFFACLGHAFTHLTTSLHYTLIISMQQDWGSGYDELLSQWTMGALLMGLGAPAAGWLADRWHEGRMLVLFFVLTGVGACLAGLVPGPGSLGAALAILGLGASIFHPAGMAWTIREARDRARAVAWVGMSGDLGFALAAPCAGLLAALAGWRFGFLVPGAVCVGLGVALAFALLAAARRGAARTPTGHQPAQPGGPVHKLAALALVGTMFATSLISWSAAAAFPRWLATAIGPAGQSTHLVGLVVGSVFLLGCTGQYASARATAWFSLKRTYVAALALELPFLISAVFIAGPLAYPVAVLMAAASSAQLAPETLLIARLTPGMHRGVAFGLRFVLSFAAAPLAVQLVAYCYRASGDFTLLFCGLAAVSCLAILTAALLLPREERTP